VGEAVRIVRQICAGLAVAHANGVTHRDVKPENVFLVGADEELTAKLLDFGISRFRGAAGKALTMAGTALGTPDYMSPEQARGMPVDHRSDIYAVGVLLYVTLTGVMPFERDSPHETLLALLQEEAPSIRLIDPSIPEPLEAVIQKAMAKNADERYPWIAQLSQALGPYDPSYAAASLAPPPATTPATTLVTLPPFSLEHGAEDLPSARRWIVGAFALGAPATFVAFLLAVVGLLAGADVEVDATVWLIVTAMLLLGMGPPLVVALRHLSASVWGQGARESALARVLRPTVLAAGSSYAFAALVLRLAQAIFLDDGAWPLGDTLLAGVALVAGVTALLLARDRG
jgi:serine/threonine-protein kinase